MTLSRITRLSWLAYSPCIHNQDSDTDCADAIQSSLDSELPFRVHNNKVASCVRYLSQPHHLTANGDSARADCQAQCQRKHIKLLGGVVVNGFRKELRAGRWDSKMAYPPDGPSLLLLPGWAASPALGLRRAGQLDKAGPLPGGVNCIPCIPRSRDEEAVLPAHNRLRRLLRAMERVCRCSRAIRDRPGCR